MSKRTVELVSEAGDFTWLKEGLELTVRVPMRQLDYSWDELGKHIDPGIAAGWTEEDLRLGCAAFCTLAEYLPILTSDLAAWVLRTGCENNVLDVVKRHFDPDRLNEFFTKKAA